MKARLRNNHTRPGRLLISAALILLGWSFCAWLAAQALIVDDPIERADALVVLSGSSAYEERVQLAAKLYHEGRGSRLVLTDDGIRGGWSEERQTNPFFVERARYELLSFGVPADKIDVLPGLVASTYDEAIAARRHAEQRNLRSLLFVTSAYHTRRALWTLRAVFRESDISVGIEGVKPGDQTAKPRTWWLSRRGWQDVALEYPKLVYYYCKYR